jgi:uncharacterized protein YjbJ (UPF0337 family)
MPPMIRTLKRRVSKDQAKGKVKQAEGDVKEALHKPHKA